MSFVSSLTRLFAPAMFAAAALSVCGCPSNMCLVKICKGNGSDCRCSWSTCPTGSEYDTTRETCVCAQGRVSLNGACLTVQQANQYCGKGSRYQNYGCVAVACPPGQELDQDTGACLAKQQVDQVAQNMGVPLGQNEKLGCPPGLVLVVENASSASCVPPQNACSRDETWNGQACVKTQRCAPGWVLDVTKNTCVPVTTPDDKYTIDLPQWTTATYGSDGGNGTSAFCSGFNKKPVTFGVTAGGSIRIRVEIGVSAPGRDVARAQVQTAAIVEASRQPVTPKGAEEVQRAATEMLATLIGQGGKSNADFARTNVACTIINGAKPAPVPASGGF